MSASRFSPRHFRDLRGSPRPWILLVCLVTGLLPSLRAQDDQLDLLDGETLYDGGWLFSVTGRVERRETLLEGEKRASGGELERMTDTTLSLSAHHGIRHDLQLSVVLPFVHRELRAHSGGSSPAYLGAGGPGDLLTVAKWRFFRWDALGKALNVSALAGLEWPTGSDDERDGGQRLDPDLQPGSGSWDPLAGLALTYEPGRWRFNAAALYQVNTESRDDIAMGDEAFAELSVGNRFWLEPYPGPFMRADLALLYRNEQRAYRDGVVQRNSGGDLVSVEVNLAFRPRPSLDIQLAVEVPVYQRVGGRQLGQEFSVSLALGYRI